MRRIIAFLSCFVFLSIFITSCSSINSNNSAPNTPLDGPAQAKHAAGASVALVTNFGSNDVHRAYCSGVWVSKDTILTAAHCSVGYANMTHTYLVYQALLASGIPGPIAKLLSNADDDDLSAVVELGLVDQDIVDAAKIIIASVPPVDPMSIDMTYIGPKQVVDTGVAPKEFFHGMVLVVDEKADLSLIRAIDYPKHYIANLADKLPEVGEELNFAGSPHNNVFSFRRVVISSYRHSEKEDGMEDIDGPFIQVNGPVFHGDSGSGMLNSRGELVGIASFIDADINMAFCIHTDTIRGMLIGQRIIKAKLDLKAKDPDLGEAKINLE